MRLKLKKTVLVLLVGFFGLLILGVIYVKTHPLVFNESFFDHAHCIAQAGSLLRIYAGDHYGQYPVSSNGYGEALLMLYDFDESSGPILAGPGCDSSVFKKARSSKTRVSEKDCGRVYIQGLGETSNPEIVVLYDKLPTPGGDHCHFLNRIFAPLGREVSFVDGDHRFIRESEWPLIATKQIDLLVKEGFTTEQAKKLYPSGSK